MKRKLMKFTIRILLNEKNRKQTLWKNLSFFGEKSDFFPL